MPVGDVVLTVVDGSQNAAVPPNNRVQAVIATCSLGGINSTLNFNQVLYSQNISQLITQFGYGQLAEKCSLVIQGGGAVLAVPAKIVTAGALTNSVAHTYTGTGTIGTAVLTVTFTDPTNIGAFDDYQVVVTFLSSGTIGGATPVAPTMQISLDNNRTFGPAQTLTVTANLQSTFTIPQTGIILQFNNTTPLVGETVTKGDIYKFNTKAPLWSDTTVNTALSALQTSTFNFGGGIHIAGKSFHGDGVAFGNSAETLAAAFRYVDVFLDTDDAGTNHDGFGGQAQETSWMTALENDWSVANIPIPTSDKRICSGAGYYNMATGIANQTVGSPRYRRCGTWAASVRRIQVDEQVHLGRVSDGPLANIVVDTVNDPTDGYIYHDERFTPGLDQSRFMAFRTRIGQSGYFVTNANMMVAPGSDFNQDQFLAVMNVVCSLTQQNLELQVNSNVRVNASTGFILERDAQSIENSLESVLNAQVTNKGKCSAIVSHVSRTDNILITKTLTVTVRVTALGYLEEIDVTVGFANPLLV